MPATRPYPNRKPPRVKIAVPFYDSLPENFTMFAENMVYHGIPGYNVALTKKHSTIIQFARNELLREPEGLEWDYVFFLDDDLGFDKQTLSSRVPVKHPDGRMVEIPYMNALMKRILDHGKHICAGWYCQRGGDYLPLVFEEHVKDGQPALFNIIEPKDEGVEQVAAVATGFLCIHRDVIRSFDRERDQHVHIWRQFEKWREANSLDDFPPEVKAYLEASKPAINPPFWLEETWDPYTEKWLSCGEDVFFCREARRLGYEIWVDWSVSLGHEGKLFITPEHFKANNQQRYLADREEFWRKQGKDVPAGKGESDGSSSSGQDSIDRPVEAR